MPRQYSYPQIVEALETAGLKPGDTIFVSTSFGMLGILEGTDSSDDLNLAHLKAIQQVLGPSGTIVVPTYSYTIGRSTATNPAVFDPLTTPAEIGPFPNFFLKQPEVIRSPDPMTSCAALGPKANILFHDLPSTSYGKDCLFDRLRGTNTKCISIGLGPNWTPFLHYADWLSRVPFRYEKIFKGILKSNGREVSQTWVYYVAINHETAGADAHELAKLAIGNNIWHFAPLGRARVYVADYSRYLEFTLAQLKKNPWITAKGPTNNSIFSAQQKVTNRVDPIIEDSLENIILSADKYNRDDVSAGIDKLLKSLNQTIELSIHAFKTGENHYDWIIPEKWTVKKAFLKTEEGEIVLQDSGVEGKIYSNSLSWNGWVKKSELQKHVAIHPYLRNAQGYMNVVHNRDWGFCLSQAFWDSLQNDRYHVDIKTDFTFGTLKVAQLNKLKSDRPIILILGYLNGATGTKDLISAYTAIQIYQSLKELSTQINFQFCAILTPSPAGVAAWLKERLSSNETISMIVELSSIFDISTFSVRLPSDFKNNPLIKSIRQFKKVRIDWRKNKEAFCMQSGENPCAIEKMPYEKYPIISLGGPLSIEVNYEKKNSDEVQHTPIKKGDLDKVNANIPFLIKFLVSITKTLPR